MISYGRAVSRTRLGTRVLIGAPARIAAGCGVAYDYARPGSTWREKAEVGNPDCKIYGFFGEAAALWGRTTIIGAPIHAAVYVTRIL